jgi:hypothetical protein
MKFRSRGSKISFSPLLGSNADKDPYRNQPHEDDVVDHDVPRRFRMLTSPGMVSIFENEQDCTKQVKENHQRNGYANEC